MSAVESSWNSSSRCCAPSEFSSFHAPRPESNRTRRVTSGGRGLRSSGSSKASKLPSALTTILAAAFLIRGGKTPRDCSVITQVPSTSVCVAGRHPHVPSRSAIGNNLKAWREIANKFWPVSLGNLTNWLPHPGLQFHFAVFDSDRVFHFSLAALL